MTIIIIIGSITLLILIGLACYTFSSKVLLRFLLFLALLVVQISPVIIFKAVGPSHPEKTAYIGEAFNDCMQEESSRFGRVSEYAFDSCKRESNWHAAKHFDEINGFFLFLFSLFIVTPIAGLSERSLRGFPLIIINIKKSTESKERTLLTLKIIGKSFLIVLVIAIGFTIVWGYCLPPAYVNKTIKTLSLVIGLPFIASVGVLAEAFGRAFAYSGVHSPQNAIKEIIEEKQE